MAAKTTPETETESTKLALHLTGPSKGPPTVDDIMALVKSLTGRDPTPEEYVSSKAKIEAHVAKKLADAGK